jgi:hypothetical protein
MLPNNHLRLLVHLDDKQGKGLITLVSASISQHSPELLSAERVVGLLEVDEGRVVPPLLALPKLDLSEEPRNLSCC